jgi:hypothetical protein
MIKAVYSGEESPNAFFAWLTGEFYDTHIKEGRIKASSLWIDRRLADRILSKATPQDMMAWVDSGPKPKTTRKKNEVQYEN